MSDPDGPDPILGPLLGAMEAERPGGGPVLSRALPRTTRDLLHGQRHADLAAMSAPRPEDVARPWPVLAPATCPDGLGDTGDLIPAAG